MDKKWFKKLVIKNEINLTEDFIMEKNMKTPMGEKGKISTTDKKPGGGKRALFILLIIVLIAAAGGAYWFIDSMNYVTLTKSSIAGLIVNDGPKIMGKVDTVNVKVGSAVKSGDILFTLNKEAAQFQLNQSQAAYNIAEIQLAKAKLGARPQELQGIEALAAQAKAAYDSAQKTRENLVQSQKDLKSKYSKLLVSLKPFLNKDTGAYSAATAYAQLDELRASGSITDAQYTFKASNINTLFSAKTTLESQISQIDDQIKLLDIQLVGSKAGVTGANTKVELTKLGATELDIKMLENQLDVSKNSLELAKMNFSNTEVKATIDGTVIKVGFISGDNAIPGSTVVSIVNMDKLYVNGNVDESESGQVKVGQTVDLTVSAFPGVTFKGEVTEVGYATLLTIDPYSTNGTTSSSGNANQVVQVKISIDSMGKNIKPGLTVEGKIKVK